MCEATAKTYIKNRKRNNTNMDDQASDPHATKYPKWDERNPNFSHARHSDEKDSFRPHVERIPLFESS